MNADVAPTTQNHTRQIEVMILTKLRDFKRAAELAQKLLADSAVKGQLRGVAVAKMRLGLIKLEQDELGGALEYFEQAPNDFKQIGDKRGEAWALTHLSEVLLKLGRPAKAQEAFLKGARLTSQIGVCTDEYKDLLTRILALRPPSVCVNEARLELERMKNSASLFDRRVF